MEGFFKEDFRDLSDITKKIFLESGSASGVSSYSSMLFDSGDPDVRGARILSIKMMKKYMEKPNTNSPEFRRDFDMICDALAPFYIHNYITSVEILTKNAMKENVYFKQLEDQEKTELINDVANNIRSVDRNGKILQSDSVIKSVVEMAIETVKSGKQLHDVKYDALNLMKIITPENKQRQPGSTQQNKAQSNQQPPPGAQQQANHGNQQPPPGAQQQQAQAKVSKAEEMLAFMKDSVLELRNAISGKKDKLNALSEQIIKIKEDIENTFISSGVSISPAMKNEVAKIDQMVKNGNRIGKVMDILLKVFDQIPGVIVESYSYAVTRTEINMVLEEVKKLENKLYKD